MAEPSNADGPEPSFSLREQSSNAHDVPLSMDAGVVTEQSCRLSNYNGIKAWFVAVIKPNFRGTEAQQALGIIASPRTARLALSEQNMYTLRDSFSEHNPERLTTKEQVFCCRRWFSPLQPGSVRSCTAALAATSLGSGSIALPYAFALTGIGLGVVTMILAVIVSSLSLQILMVAARYTNSRSYAAIMHLVARSRVISFSLDLCIVLNGIGAITCILIFEGDFVPGVLAYPPWQEHGLDLDRRIAVMLVALAAYPLTFPTDLSALRYTSVVVPVVLIATIIIVLSEVPKHLATVHERGESIIWWDFNLKRWLTAVPIMVNAFTNHQNAVPTGNQLDQPSVARIVKATLNANLIVFVILVSMGIGGYASFGQETQGNFIKNYAGETDNTGIWVCRLMLAITVYFVIPVALSPAAKSCAQLVLSATGQDRPVGRVLHIFSCTLVLGACTGIAVATSDIASVVGILGGLIASTVMFWFPAIIYWFALWPTQPPICRYVVLAAILFFGVCGYASVVVMFLK